MTGKRTLPVSGIPHGSRWHSPWILGRGLWALGPGGSRWGSGTACPHSLGSVALHPPCATCSPGSVTCPGRQREQRPRVAGDTFPGPGQCHHGGASPAAPGSSAGTVNNECPPNAWEMDIKSRLFSSRDFPPWQGRFQGRLQGGEQCWAADTWWWGLAAAGGFWRD